MTFNPFANLFFKLIASEDIMKNKSKKLIPIRLERCAKLINKKFKDYTVIDIGCRTMTIKPHLNNCKQYYGTDLIPTDGVLACDLNKPLEYEDNSYDIVLAMDVLEHLDRPHEALKELMRIARKAVYVSLPNIFYIKFRTSFLMGNGISSKYTFHNSPVEDRHRWIMSYDESINFMEFNVDSSRLYYETLVPKRNDIRKIFTPFHNVLAKLFPNLFAHGVLFEIKLT